MFDIENYPLILDSVLHHCTPSTLGEICLTSKPINRRATSVLYSHVTINAARLGSLHALTSSKRRPLQYTLILEIYGCIPRSLGHATATISALQEHHHLPRLRSVEWRPEAEQLENPQVEYSFSPCYDPLDLPESTAERLLRTLRCIVKLPCRDLVIKGSFAILQCTRASTVFDDTKAENGRNMTFYIETAADLAHDCPIPVSRWTAMQQQATVKRRLDIVLARGLAQLTQSAALACHFPAPASPVDRISYLVHAGHIHLALVGFETHQDDRTDDRAKYTWTVKSGERLELDERDLASCILHKLWQTYTISPEEGDKVRLLSKEEWEHEQAKKGAAAFAIA